MDGDIGAIASTTELPEREEDNGRIATAPQRMRVQDLLRGQRELILLLDESEYRLRITSKGKLILTK